MLISVIVPFLNATRTLPLCLDALAAQHHKAFEVILVDNGPGDRSSAAMIKQFLSAHPAIKTTVVAESVRGAAAARNTGVRVALGDWIAFTDADCIPAPDWLTDLAMAAARHPDAAAFAGTILPAPSTGTIASFLGLYTLPAVSREQWHEHYTLVAGGFPTANFMVRKNVFEQIGGFDQGMIIYGEDHDLCMRIYENGGRIRSLVNAQVQHIHRDSLKGLVKQSFGFGRSHAQMLRRMPGGVLLLLLPGFRMVKQGVPIRAWIDLHQADKKLLAAVLACLFWLPLVSLVPAYLVYLYVSIYRRADNRHAIGSPQTVFAYECLLLLKSVSMTMGRIYGSLKYRVFCL